MVKVLVLFSGGLDSRLAGKLLQEQNIKIETVFFLLPFSKQEVPEIDKKIKTHVVNCTKGKIFSEYLEIIKKPKFCYGVGLNPCVDCRIFLLKKAKEFAEKIKADFVATGEVLGERPMSQTPTKLKIIDEEIGEILRPLSAKLLPETEAEKKKLVDRSKLFNIQGRSRKKQIELAEKYKISYPSPAGGCLLCEKELASRIKFLLDKNLINEKTLPLTKIGRHFHIEKGGWFVVGRNEQENNIIEKYKQAIKSGKGKPAVYFHNINEKNIKVAKELQKVYKSKDLKLREEFEKQRM